MRFDVPDSFMLLAVVGGIHATDVIDWELGDDMIDRFIMLAGSDALEEAMEIVRIIGDPNLAKLMLPEGDEKITPANTDRVVSGVGGSQEIEPISRRRARELLTARFDVSIAWALVP